VTSRGTHGSTSTVESIHAAIPTTLITGAPWRRSGGSTWLAPDRRALPRVGLTRRRFPPPRADFLSEILEIFHHPKLTMLQSRTTAVSKQLFWQRG
jgi:hypothetical protein